MKAWLEDDTLDFRRDDGHRDVVALLMQAAVSSEPGTTTLKHALSDLHERSKQGARRASG